MCVCVCVCVCVCENINLSFKKPHVIRKKRGECLVPTANLCCILEHRDEIRFVMYLSSVLPNFEELKKQ